MKIFDKDLPIYLVGDHHGAWSELFHEVDVKNIENCHLISVGDLGIGFKYKREYEYKQCEKLNEKFKEKNILFKGIRGNHDNPSYFKGDDRISLSNFELIEDYSSYSYGDKTIQFVGGAVSIDRTGRQANVSYWENEGVEFKRDLCQQVDCLIMHTAPSWCFPQQFNEIVYGWAREDAYLLEDLTEERAIVDEIFKLCKPSFFAYGHFHSSNLEVIEQCKYKLLNINEFYELRF